MNEKIKLFMVMAEDPDHGFIIPEKFAELIVRECANVAWDIAHQYNSDEINDVGYSILQHFGVE